MDISFGSTSIILGDIISRWWYQLPIFFVLNQCTIKGLLKLLGCMQVKKIIPLQKSIHWWKHLNATYKSAICEAVVWVLSRGRAASCDDGLEALLHGWARLGLRLHNNGYLENQQLKCFLTCINSSAEVVNMRTMFIFIICFLLHKICWKTSQNACIMRPILNHKISYIFLTL